MRSLCLTFSLILLAAGIGSGQNKTDPVLTKLDAAFIAAYNQRDATKVAAFYAEDAVLMPPNAPMVRGRAAIEAYYKDGFAHGVSSIKITPLESAISGEHAFEAGTAVVTTSRGSSMLLAGVDGAGDSTADNIKFLATYRRVRGEWKIADDIFNTDRPASK